DLAEVPAASFSKCPSGEIGVLADLTQSSSERLLGLLCRTAQRGRYSSCGMATAHTAAKAVRQSATVAASVVSWRSATSPLPVKTVNTTVVSSNNQKSLPGTAIPEAIRRGSQRTSSPASALEPVPA